MKPQADELSKPVRFPFFKKNSFQIGFLFTIPLSQLLEGTWSGCFLRLETEAQRSDVTVTGAESDLLPMVVSRPWVTMAFKALPELTLPLAVSEKWWCHCQGNGGQLPSGEGQPRVCMFRVDREPWSSASFSCLCTTRSFSIHFTPASSSSFNFFSPMAFFF